MGQVLSYIKKLVLGLKFQNQRNKVPQNDTNSNKLVHPSSQQHPEESHCIIIDIPDIETKQEPIISSGSNLGNVPDFGPEVPCGQTKEYDEPEVERYVDKVVQHKFISVPNYREALLGSNSSSVSKIVCTEEEKEQFQLEGRPDNVLRLASKNKNEQKHKEVDTKVRKATSQHEIIRRIGPYTSMQKILLVGEGDFSFSSCLAVAFASATNIVATSLNSQDFLATNYSKFLTNKNELETRGCMVIHDVNARCMYNHPLLKSKIFDRIIFNFPHAGKFGRNDTDMRKNQKLVREFFKNAKKMIDYDDGEIHITHKSNEYFLQWDIPKLGWDHGLHLIQEVKFKVKNYPGYHTKYGFGGDKDFDCNPSKTYKFALHSK